MNVLNDTNTCIGHAIRNEIEEQIYVEFMILF